VASKQNVLVMEMTSEHGVKGGSSELSLGPEVLSLSLIHGVFIKVISAIGLEEAPYLLPELIFAEKLDVDVQAVLRMVVVLGYHTSASLAATALLYRKVRPQATS
jgi:hypothetical protein